IKQRTRKGSLRLHEGGLSRGRQHSRRGASPPLRPRRLRIVHVEEIALPRRGAGAGVDLLVHTIRYSVIGWVKRDGRGIAPALEALVTVKVPGKRVGALVDQEARS